MVAAHRHDPEAFTQGLLCASGADAAAASSTSEEDCAVFWESTGLYGRTSVRLVDRKSGKVLRQQPPAAIDDQHFGEGVVAVGDELLLLTWQSNVGLVFDRRTLEPKREFVSTFHSPVKSDLHFRLRPPSHPTNCYLLSPRSSRSSYGADFCCRPTQ